MIERYDRQHSDTQESHFGGGLPVRTISNSNTPIKGHSVQFVIYIRLFYAIFFIGILTTVNAFASSATVEGAVVDSLTREPLPGATVTLIGTGMGAATHLNGRFTIRHVPPGIYKLRTVFVGYRTKRVFVKVVSGAVSRVIIMLRGVGLKAKDNIVTGQASGQNGAINQQLSSDRIENVVSAGFIKELPDANAAESVGRLPGVSLIREGGQATEVVIRGLEPKYNLITIDGVRMPGNDYSDRAVDLSMISSSMLGGIQVTKAITPDMDAAVLGGVVNFTLREATSNKPQIHLLAQGEYDNLMNTHNGYKFVATFEKRFFSDKFGLFAEGDAERQDLSANELGADYVVDTKNFGIPNKVLLLGMTLADIPKTQRRYDGTLTMDYRLPDGKIGLMNFFSYGIANTVDRSESFNLSTGDNGTSHIYALNASETDLTEATSILDFQQQVSALNVHLKLSNSFSQNLSPYINSWSFTQGSPTGYGTYADESLSPQEIPALANDSLLITNFSGAANEYNILRQDNLGASLDIKRGIDFSSNITSVLKFGGAFTFADRSYNSMQSSGGLSKISSPGAIKELEQEYPWMQATINSYGPILPLFVDSTFSYGNFLGGKYKMGLPINLGLMEQVMKVLQRTATPESWVFNSFQSVTNNYWGKEYRSAGYGMVTVHFGHDLTFLPGVRYQVLQTLYGAPRGTAQIGPDAVFQYPHFDTTMDLSHGFWLPMVHLIYDPTPWLQIHLAYTNTITYPDFIDITPELFVSTNSVEYHNYLLKPGTSANYDAIVSLYNNTIGLLSADGFYKRIDNLIFSTGETYVINAAQYPGVPNYADGYPLYTYVNDPYPAYVYGVELDWQTHFWYLPGLLSGLILNVNYTHINSTAKYPFTYLDAVHPTYPVVIDTINTYFPDRLIDQPNDIVNLTVGYDLGGFGARVAMQYTSNIFSAYNFWPGLRSATAPYLEWDAQVKQNLPWSGLQLFLDLNNINGAKETTINQGSNFPSSEAMYGMTANLGMRLRI